MGLNPPLPFWKEGRGEGVSIILESDERVSRNLRPEGVMAADASIEQFFRKLVHPIGIVLVRRACQRFEILVKIPVHLLEYLYVPGVLPELDLAVEKRVLGLLHCAVKRINSRVHPVSVIQGHTGDYLVEGRVALSHLFYQGIMSLVVSRAMSVFSRDGDRRGRKHQG